VEVYKHIFINFGRRVVKFRLSLGKRAPEMPYNPRSSLKIVEKRETFFLLPEYESQPPGIPDVCELNYKWSTLWMVGRHILGWVL
jgi:hypothetical protein